MRKFLVVCSLLFSVLLTIGEAKATLLAVEGTGIPSYAPPYWYINPVTLDTETGLQWLNVFQVRAGGHYQYGGELPYDFLMQSLAPGGQYYGWKLASAVQVLTLFDHAGLPSNVFGFNDTLEQFGAEAFEFQELLGRYWYGGHSNDYASTWGIVSDSPGPGWLATVSLDTSYVWTERAGGNPADDLYMKIWSGSDGVVPFPIEAYNSYNEHDTMVGAWLFREQPEAIPEPSTVLLMGFGLFGLVVWRKRTSG